MSHWGNIQSSVALFKASLIAALAVRSKELKASEAYDIIYVLSGGELIGKQCVDLDSFIQLTISSEVQPFFFLALVHEV